MIHTWDGFTEALRASYQLWEYNLQIIDDIQARRQQKGETINEYAVAIRELFLRMRTPPSEEEQIQRIIVNLQPNYHPYLKQENLHTYAELECQGKTAEAIHKHIHQFKAIPVPTVKDPPKKNKDQTERLKNKESTPPPAKPTPSAYNTMWCEFCSIRGHFYGECKKERHIPPTTKPPPPPVTHITNMIDGGSQTLPYVALEV